MQNVEINKPLCCSLCLQILLVAVLLLSHTAVIAQENYIVTGMSFSGNKTFSASELKATMSIYARNWFQRTVLRRHGYIFSHKILDEDLEQLKKFYQREGFINVEILPPVLSSDHTKQHVEIAISINEGSPVLVNQVTYNIHRNASVADSMAAQAISDKSFKKVSLQKNSRFRDAAVLDDLRLFVDELGKKGFAYAAADYELVVNENTVDIHWSIQPGPICSYADITISGNSRVSTKTVAKQVQPKPGKTFNLNELRDTQWQIYELGVFDFVTVLGVLDRNQTKDVPVKIEVKEGRRTSARFGGGYGREEKLRAFATFVRHGIFGGVRRLRLFLNTSALEPYNINLHFSQPGFIWPRTQLDINPFILNQNEPAFSALRYGGNIGMTYKLDRRSQSTLTYTLENVEQEIFSDTNLSLADTALYNKSSITLGLMRDTSSPIFEPYSGFFTSGQYTISGIGFASEFRFNKISFDIRHYMPIRFGSVLALRGKVGWIISRDEDRFIPPEERFYSGGSNSVRGWLRQQLGPKDQNGIPIGGKTLFEGSIEWRQNMVGHLGAVAFLDFGNVWAAQTSFRISEIRYAAGAGIRYSTPIGPMRFDLARPIFDEETALQWHLSVGHAF